MPVPAEKRFLISLSGWGAFSLILRSPEFYGYAVAWFEPYGTFEHIGLYSPDKLLPKQKEFFQKQVRLVLTGENCWGVMVPAPGGGSHTVEMHKLMEKEGVKYLYDNSLKVPHRWDKLWVEPTLKLLKGLTKQEK